VPHNAVYLFKILLTIVGCHLATVPALTFAWVGTFSAFRQSAIAFIVCPSLLSVWMRFITADSSALSPKGFLPSHFPFVFLILTRDARNF